MPHVSNRKLEEKHQEALYKELLTSLERCFDSEKGQLVLNQFFTRTEKEMFAKRFAVIAMLSKEIPVTVISDKLKMSPVTINTMAVKYESSRYDWVVKAALGKKNIWEIIENILTVGGTMPSRVGNGRWKNFNKSIRKENLRRN